MTTMTEFLPEYPRKTSAHKRRQCRTRLPYELHQIVPGAVSVLATAVHSSLSPAPEQMFITVVYDADGGRIWPSTAGRTRIVQLLQGAFPQADWSVSQSWRADTNRLTAQIPGCPAWMREAS